MNAEIAPTAQPASRVQRVRHEIVRRALTVRRAEAITPHFRRVVLAGDALAGFVSASFDDHLKFMLPGADGQPVMRDYTPRHYDATAGELTLEFALHGDGPAAAWAARAAAGDAVAIAGPRGSLVIPMDYDWHLLAGDATAFPAIARRLQELPAGTPVHAVLLEPDPAERRDFATRADLRLQWAASPAELLDAVRALPLPPGEGYAWCAGEAGAMAALRRILVEDKGHPRQAIRAAAYWKQGAAGHHENLGD